jgi:glycosyltransferase involved in cell wall biosynthesis
MPSAQFDQDPQVASAPQVSVVIATRNRARLLPANIASVLRGVEGIAAEVIYVNDGSTDDTSAVLAAYGDRIRWVEAENARAPGRARNVGVGLARGEWLLFTDDDCLIPERWAQNLLRLQAKHGCDALSGGFLPVNMETAAERYYEHRMRTIFGRTAKPISAAPMMCFLVRRSAFEAIGGFSPMRLSSQEDWELCYRLARAGHPIMYDPEVSVGHEYARDWGYVFRRVTDTAWIAPLVWRHAGVNAFGKLAKDTARFLGSPVWCLRYFPLDLYPQAVGLEALYYAIRLASVVSSTVTGGGVFRRYERTA